MVCTWRLPAYIGIFRGLDKNTSGPCSYHTFDGAGLMLDILHDPKDLYTLPVLVF